MDGFSRHNTRSLQAKIQRNAERLPDHSRFCIDFAKVTSIDAGAAVGIVDGVQFSWDSNHTLEINLSNISDHFYQQLVRTGLPKNILINGQPQKSDFDFEGSLASNSTSSTSSVRKRPVTTESL